MMIGFILFPLVAYVILRMFWADSNISLAWSSKPKPDAFRNKVVWITGASSGIGKALAVAFARAGSRLVLSSRDEAALNRVKAELQQQFKMQDDAVAVVPLDLADFKTLSVATDQVMKLFGRVDILVNNGGMTMRVRAEDWAFEMDEKIFNVDFIGQVCLTKSLLPHLIKQRSGHIVNISSLAGKVGTPLRTAYCGAKHGLIGYFDALRLEMLTYNVNVLNVCPGYVATNISRNALDKKGDKYGIMEKQVEQGLPASRCADLILTAVANNLAEIWIGRKMELLWFYMAQYMPNLALFVTKRMASSLEKASRQQIEDAQKKGS